MTTKTVDVVPETDAELEAKLAASARAAKAKRNAAPKPPAKPEAKEEAANPVPTPRTGNSAYAPEDQRELVRGIMAGLREAGWTRPAISAITGFSDSQVWRAQNSKVHTAELDTWMTFFEEVKAGTHKPPTSGRKPKLEDVLSRVQEATEILANEAKTVAQYRKVVEAAQEILNELVRTDDAAA